MGWFDFFNDNSQQQGNAGFLPMGDAQTYGMLPSDFSKLTPPTEVANPNAMDWFSRNNMFGGTDPKTGMVNSGWVSPVVGAASGIANAWTGMQQLGLAKDQLNFQKDAYTKNYENQRQLTNSQLEDRQRTRYASAGGEKGNVETVEDYMARNKIV